ncbi:MAG: MFS transporter [Rhodopila sp.]|nr:MFS transporter [Rhodopila sp.]
MPSATNKTLQPPLARPKTNFRWFVMALIGIIWVIATADRANLGVALPYIRKEFSLTNTETGIIISLFAYGYAVVQLPIGLLYKKLGASKTRLILPLSMLLTSLFTGLMGTVTSPFFLRIYRIGLGLSEGPFGVGSLNVLNYWFPAKEKGTTGGLLQAATKFGPLMVPVICVAIAEAFGWREIFYLFAIPGVVLSFVWWILVPSSPSQSRFCSPDEVAYIETEQTPATSRKKIIQLTSSYRWGRLDKIIRSKRLKPLGTVGEVYTSWNIIGTALAWGCMSGINATMMAWIPTYLVNAKGFASIQMGFLASAPFLGSVMGTTLGGLISDRLLGKRRKPCMMVSTICTTLLTAAMAFAPNNGIYLGALLYLTGLLIGLGYGGFSVYPMGVTTKEAYPVAFSLVNFVGQIGSASIPLFIGIVLDASSWDMAFFFLAATSVLCFFLITSLDEPVDDTMVPPE